MSKLIGYKRIDRDLELLEMKSLAVSDGLFTVTPSVPDSLLPHLTKTMQLYYSLPKNLQRLVHHGQPIRGRAGLFLFQTSHGTQQVKLYQPWIYKNEVNTPLRIRSRKIMQLTMEHPSEERKEIMNDLYRNYPYHLLKTEPVNLRMKNFYFVSKPKTSAKIKVYRALNPNNPVPDTDPFYCIKHYKDRAIVKFEYEGRNEEYYYAVNTSNNRQSNVLKFIWQHEIEFTAKQNRNPDKWAGLAEIFLKNSHVNNHDYQSLIAAREQQFNNERKPNTSKMSLPKKMLKSHYPLFLYIVHRMRRKLDLTLYLELLAAVKKPE